MNTLVTSLVLVQLNLVKRHRLDVRICRNGTLRTGRNQYGCQPSTACTAVSNDLSAVEYVSHYIWATHQGQA